MKAHRTPRRRVAPVEGLAALSTWKKSVLDEATAMPETTKTAVRFSLEELATRAPGHSVEVRVPPHGVTQCITGVNHTRGTPPNVVETDGITWLSLVTGLRDWADAVHQHHVDVSGTRANLNDFLPLFPADELL